MSHATITIHGFGSLNLDHVKRLSILDIKNHIREFNEEFYLANIDNEFVAIRENGETQILSDDMFLYDFLNCEFKFVEKTRSKPQIRVRNKTIEQVVFINAPFPEGTSLQASYKNVEVDNGVDERLFLSSNAVELLFSIIGWDLEIETNIVEQAGLLVGKRCKDNFGSIWGNVITIIPLKETPSSRRGILMTSDSFYEALNHDFPVLKASNPELDVIGWYHTHTFSDQPVFSATDYQAQSSIFASNQPCFALVLNSQQRTFASYFGSRSELIKSFIECTDAINARWKFSINEKYYGSEQKARIKKGAYSLEQQKEEIERLRKELNEREKRISKQLSSIQIQEQRISREKDNLEAEKRQLESQKKEYICLRQTINKQQAEISKSEKHLKDLQDLLMKIFPLAFEPNDKFFSKVLSPLINFSPIQVRRISSSYTYPNDNLLDIFYDPTRSNYSAEDAGKEMSKHGKILNALRNMIYYQNNYRNSLEFCAVINYEPQRFLLLSIIPLREIYSNLKGNTILYALDKYEKEKVLRVKQQIVEYKRYMNLYIYIEECQCVFKVS